MKCRDAFHKTSFAQTKLLIRQNSQLVIPTGATQHPCLERALPARPVRTCDKSPILPGNLESLECGAGFDYSDRGAASYNPPLKFPKQRQYLSGEMTWMSFERGHAGSMFTRPDKCQLFGNKNFSVGRLLFGYFFSAVGEKVTGVAGELHGRSK